MPTAERPANADPVRVPRAAEQGRSGRTPIPSPAKRPSPAQPAARQRHDSPAQQGRKYTVQQQIEHVDRMHEIAGHQHRQLLHQVWPRLKRRQTECQRADHQHHPGNSLDEASQGHRPGVVTGAGGEPGSRCTRTGGAPRRIRLDGGGFPGRRLAVQFAGARARGVCRVERRDRTRKVAAGARRGLGDATIMP